MELRDSAEQVLFATTLDEKLQSPAAVNVYSQSKGRTPSVFVFNPFSEGHIARGKSFTPVKRQAVLASDLANLPQFLCRSDDIVLVAKRPSVDFLNAVKQAGFPLPEFVELKDGRVEPASNLCRRKLGSLRPWAWGPDSVELLEPLFAQVTGEASTASQRFNEHIARLYSKAWSADFSQNHVRLAARARDSAPCRRNLALHRGRGRRGGGYPRRGARSHCGHSPARSSSGRGQGSPRFGGPQRHSAVGTGGLAAQQQWLARAVQNGRQVVIEPWLERELDFSVQLEMGPRSLKLCGYTGLINDRKGQFQANWAAANYDRRIPANVAALFREPADISGRLQRLYDDILSLLEAELQRAGFVGPVGIDVSSIAHRRATAGSSQSWKSIPATPWAD